MRDPTCFYLMLWAWRPMPPPITYILRGLLRLLAGSPNVPLRLLLQLVQQLQHAHGCRGVQRGARHAQRLRSRLAHGRSHLRVCMPRFSHVMA